MFSLKLSFSNINKLLKTLSQVFLVSSVILVLYILVKFFTIQQELSKMTLNAPSIDSTQTPEKLIQKFAPFSEYESILSNRDFFQLPKEKPAQVAAPVQLEPTAKDITKSIKIIGLMLTNNPKIIIENLTTHETNVLSVGDKIENLILKEIRKDKLIFDQQGKSLELIIK